MDSSNSSIETRALSIAPQPRARIESIVGIRSDHWKRNPEKYFASNKVLTEGSKIIQYFQISIA
jgi:hypothetical protein